MSWEDDVCGRYVSARSAGELSARFRAADKTGGKLQADFNVAPTKPVPAILSVPGPLPEPGSPGASAQRRQASRQLRLLRWGLIPPWAADPKIGSRMINARKETVDEKPAYRQAFAYRRCLLPADGYYEWQLPDDPRGRKQPVYLSPASGEPLALAGLWERWTGPDGQQLASCVVLTTTAVGELGHVHDRAPVVVSESDWDSWLDPLLRDRVRLRTLLGRLAPLPANDTAHWPVSTEVNSVRNNGAHLRQRLVEPA